MLEIEDSGAFSMCFKIFSKNKKTQTKNGASFIEI